MPSERRRWLAGTVLLSVVLLSSAVRADILAVSLPYAGTGQQSFFNGPGPLVSTFKLPSGVAVATASPPLSGTVYIVDRGNNALRKIEPNLLSLTPLPPELPLGTVSTVAMPAGQALKEPFDAVFDSAGNLWVSDQGNHKLRKFDAGGNLLATIGSGAQGQADLCGASATFDFPSGLGAAGGFVYVADASNHRIRQVDIATGCVATVAGSAAAFAVNCGTFCGVDNGGFADGAALTAAKFDCPADVAVEPLTGALYVADFCNHAIRKIAGGQVTTVAGGPPPTPLAGLQDGVGSAARFKFPFSITFEKSIPTQTLSGIGLDKAEFYVGDFGNAKIRRVGVAGSGGSDVNTLAVLPVDGITSIPTDIEIPPLPFGILAAPNPEGIAVLPSGALLVARGIQAAVTEVVTLEPPPP